MNKIIVVLLIFMLSGCNDGDIITTSFDFEGSNLQYCDGGDASLFYKLNASGLEGVALRLTNQQGNFQQTQTIEVNLDENNNFFTYRIFNAEVDGSYFCAEIPPTQPEVVSEFLANSGTAILEIVTQFTDTDGIVEDLTILEDTDGDGLLNYFDFDDDGDNVPTISELDFENADGDNNPLTNPKDTDNDGIPDYLDEDDDGDGILTRYEDLNGDLDPTNDINDPTIGPNYINPKITSFIKIDVFREHNYNYNTNLDLSVENLILNNGEEQINRAFFEMGTLTNIESGVIITLPDFPVN